MPEQKGAAPQTELIPDEPVIAKTGSCSCLLLFYPFLTARDIPQALRELHGIGRLDTSIRMLLFTLDPDKIMRIHRPTVEPGSPQWQTLPYASREDQGPEQVLLLRDTTVSGLKEGNRSHAVIRREGESWVIEDTRDPARQAQQRCNNPVVVNGQSISTKVRLQGGEVITVGSTLLKFLQPRMPGAADQDAIVDVEDKLFVGGPALADIRTKLKQASATLANVLLHGETGTGKEAATLWMHRLLGDPARPRIGFSCPSYSKDLIHTELFGVDHDVGGGLEERLGVFEKAGDGMVLLDEIGEIDYSIQPTLLRAIGERQFTRYGGKLPIPIRCWIVSATTRNLQEAVRNGTFQDQLLGRLSQCPVELPPLRDRPEDIPLLIRHFLFFSEDSWFVAIRQNLLGRRTPAAGPLLLVKYFRHFCGPPTNVMLTDRELSRVPVHIRAVEQLCAQRWEFNVRGLRDRLLNAILPAVEGKIDVLTTEVLDLPDLSAEQPTAAAPAAPAAPATAASPAPAPAPAAAPATAASAPPLDPLFLREIATWQEYVRQYLAAPAPESRLRFAALRDLKWKAARQIDGEAKDGTVRKRLSRQILLLWDFFAETLAASRQLGAEAADLSGPEVAALVAAAFREGLRQIDVEGSTARELGEVLAERLSAKDILFGEKDVRSTAAGDEFKFDNRTILVTPEHWSLVLAVGAVLRG